MQDILAGVLRSICGTVSADFCALSSGSTDNSWEILYNLHDDSITQIADCGIGMFSDRKLFISCLDKSGEIHISSTDSSTQYSRLGINCETAIRNNIRDTYIFAIKINGRTAGWLGLSYTNSHYTLTDSEVSFMRECAHILESVMYARESNIRLHDADNEIKRNRIQMRLLGKAAADFAENSSDISTFILNPLTREISGSSALEKMVPIKDGKALQTEAHNNAETAFIIDSSFEKLCKGEEKQIEFTYNSDYFAPQSTYRVRVEMCEESEEPLIIGVIQDVTAIIRKNRHEAEAAELRSRIFDTMPVMYFIKNADKGFVYQDCNAAFADHISKKREEIIGQNDVELFSKDARELFEKNNLEVIKSGEQQTFIEKYSNKAGRIETYKTIKVPFVNAEGERCLFGLRLDITELDDEKVRNANEAKMRALTMQKCHGIFCLKDIDDNFRYIDCNEYAARTIGLKREDVIGKTDFEIMERESAERIRSNNIRMAESNADSMFHTDKVRTITGDLKKLHFSYNVLVNKENGHRLLFVFASDVTMEEEMLASQKCISEQLKYVVGEKSFINIGQLLKLMNERISAAGSRLYKLNSGKDKLEQTYAYFANPENCGRYLDMGMPEDELIRQMQAAAKPGSQDRLHFDRYLVIPVYVKNSLWGCLEIYTDKYSVTLNAQIYDFLKQSARTVGIALLRNIELENAEISNKELQLSQAQKNFCLEVTGCTFFTCDTDIYKYHSVTINEKTPIPIGENSSLLNPAEWVCPEDVHVLVENVNKLRQGSKTVSYGFKTDYYGDTRYYYVWVRRESCEDYEYIGCIQDMTEFIAERTAKENTQRMWTTLLDNIPVGVYVQDADDNLRYIQVNRFFGEFFGRSAADFTGRFGDELLGEAIEANCKAQSMKLIRSGLSHMEFEEKLRDADGAMKSLHTSETLYKDQSGRRLLLGTIEDVTETVRLRNLERANAEILRATLTVNTLEELLERSSVILGKLVSSNKITWIYADSRIQLNFPAGASPLSESLLRIVDNGTEFKEVQITSLPSYKGLDAAKADGETKAMFSLKVNMEDKCAGLIVICFKEAQNVTEDYSGQMQIFADTTSSTMLRIRNQRHIEESEELLRRIMDSIPMPLVIKDIENDLRYTMCNDEFCRLVNKDCKNDIIGHTDWEIFNEHIANQIVTTDREAAEGSAVQVYQTHANFVIKGSQGPKYLQGWKQPISGHDGKRLLLTIISDVTESRLRLELEHIKSDMIGYFTEHREFDQLTNYIARLIINFTHCSRVTLISQEGMYHGGAREWTENGSGTRCPESTDNGCRQNFRHQLKSCGQNTLCSEDAAARGSNSIPDSCGSCVFLSTKVNFELNFWGTITACFPAGMAQTEFERQLSKELLEITAYMLSSALRVLKEEDESKRQEREKQLLIDNTILPVAMFDGEGRLLRSNKAYKSNIVDEDTERIENGAAVIPTQNHVINGAKEYSQEWNHKGRCWKIDVHGVFNEHGRLMNIFKFAIDITESKRKMQKQDIIRRCTETVLYESKDLYTATSRIIAEVASYFRADAGNFLQFDENGNTLSLLGYCGKEFEDKFAAARNDGAFEAPGFKVWIDIMRNNWIVRTDKDKIQAGLGMGRWDQAFRDSGVQAFYSVQIMLGNKLWGNFTIYFKDPDVILSEVDLVTMRNFQHTIEMLITKNELIESIKRERDVAVKAEKDKSFFFSCISHDIRTPLNSIIGYSDLMLAGGLTQDQTNEYLRNITFSGTTLMHLIDDVLDFAKLDADKIELRRDACDFKVLAMDVMRVAERSVKDRNLDFRFEAEGTVPVVEIDIQHVNQIMLNLLNNAIKFTEKGSVTLHIKFERKTETAGSLIFWIKDTGVGIARENIAKLTKPFVRIGNKTQTGGTGLGLSICNMLVRKMGGELIIESELDAGSTFKVVLNNIRYKQAEKTNGGQQASGTEERDSLAASTLSLLLVDDCEMNLKVLRAICTKLGCSNIELAGSGEEALQKLKDRNFDAVLTDIWMPNMNGRELAEEIRRHRKWDKVHIYALTADVDERSAERSSKFDGVLLKPIRKQGLANLLSKIAASI